MGEDDFEIGNVETFGGNKDEEFSHSLLVMSAMRKCLESGSHELRPGWFNSRTDRQGNTIKTYIEDTRKVFIESVNSCMMIMSPDIDKIAEKYIDECLDSIEKKREELIQDDDRAWESLSAEGKVKNITLTGIKHIQGHLTHPVLIEELSNFEVNMYRNIVSELNRLTQRLDYYKAEMFEA